MASLIKSCRVVADFGEGFLGVSCFKAEEGEGFWYQIAAALGKFVIHGVKK